MSTWLNVNEGVNEVVNVKSQMVGLNGNVIGDVHHTQALSELFRISLN